MRFETNQEIVVQNIYRSLAKYALSVMRRDDLEYFKETIKWINGEIDFEDLPKVAMLTSYDLFSYHPKLVVYRRKYEDYSLPFAVAEFRFTFLTFVFIIPKSSKDQLNFTDEKEYEYFWNFFKHYKSVPNWVFKKMTDNVARTFVMNLNLRPSKRNKSEHTTWGFMEVGHDKLCFSKLQSRSLVRAGQTMLSISFNFIEIFSISSGPGGRHSNSQPA